VVIDQLSHRVIGFAPFEKTPMWTDLCGFLDRAIKGSDAKPQHIIADKRRRSSARPSGP